MATGLDILATRLARECERGAVLLSLLQRRLADRVDGTDADALLRDMQALDTVQQTLDDLAVVMDTLAEQTPAETCPIPDVVLDGVRQSTLRARLQGETEALIPRAVDLF